jgi:hypothetical protein
VWPPTHTTSKSIVFYIKTEAWYRELLWSKKLIENLIVRVNTKSLSRKRHKLYKKEKRSVCFMKHYSWSMWSWVGFWKMMTLVEIKNAYKKQVLIVLCLLNSCHKPITFTLKNKEGWLFSYKNTLVITIVLSNLRAQMVLIDNGSMMNIFSRKKW